MLNASELDAYFERENLSYEARQVVHNVRTSDPGRRTSSGPANVACKYPSKKMGCSIQAESHTNELAALYVWDHDLNTHEFYDQPPKIKLQYRNMEGKLITAMHTADYFILADSYTGWIECKTEEHLIKLSVSNPERYARDAQGIWHCPPGESYAASQGLGYKVRSSAENDWVLLRNLVFLSDYMDIDCPVPTAEELQIAKSLFRQKPWMPLIEVVRADDQLSADAVYKMIVDGHLHFPIYSSPISEIEYAIIYRDELSAEIYQLQTTTSSPLAEISLFQPIQLAPGEQITWGGSPWRIDNVGKTSVFMRDADGHSAELNIGDIEAYIREGKVAGLPANFSKEMESKAQALINQAGPAAMGTAVERFRLLQKDKPYEGTSLSISTIKQYKRKFRNSELLYGNGIIGLFPQTHKRGNRDRKIDDAVIELMDTVIQEYYLLPFRPQFNAVYGELLIQCKERGLLAPSSKTFRKAIKKLTLYEIELARGGKRAAYIHEEFYWRLDTETPRHGERPFDIVHIDHTQLDIELADQVYGTAFERPWLSIMIDAYSRKILAFWISFDEPSYRSCMMLIRLCVRLHGRAPRIIVVDGGSEFDSEYFEVLLAYLKVTKKSRAKSKARFGSVMERFFGTSNTQLIHNLSGNTQATKTHRQCTATHDPRKHSQWSLVTFSTMFAKWLEDVYEASLHKTLGVSPAQAFAVGQLDMGMRNHKRISDSEGFRMLCLPSTKSKTARVNIIKGVQINYLFYWCDGFRDPSLQNKQVPVRFDPDDASKAFVYVNNSWIECRSELATIFARRSVKQVELISKELKARNKQMGRKQKITAGTIAHFLRTAEITARTQQQIWRDNEHMAAYPPASPLTANDMVEVEVDGPMGIEDDADLQVYGDF